MGYRWTTPPERDSDLRWATASAPTSRFWALLGTVTVLALIALNL